MASLRILKGTFADVADWGFSGGYGDGVYGYGNGYGYGYGDGYGDEINNGFKPTEEE